MGRGSTGFPFLSSSGNWLEVCEKTKSVVTQSKARRANAVFLFTVISFFQGLKPIYLGNVTARVELVKLLSFGDKVSLTMQRIRDVAYAPQQRRRFTELEVIRCVQTASFYGLT